jgi:hypothetical protein
MPKFYVTIVKRGDRCRDIVVDADTHEAAERNVSEAIESNGQFDLLWAAGLHDRADEDSPGSVVGFHSLRCGRRRLGDRS